MSTVSKSPKGVLIESNKVGQRVLAGIRLVQETIHATSIGGRFQLKPKLGEKLIIGGTQFGQSHASPTLRAKQ
jgi:hypothetical protein